MERRSKQIAELTNTRIRKLAVESGIYDCITDPFDKLKNGDKYSSVMPDLERFAELIIQDALKKLQAELTGEVDGDYENGWTNGVIFSMEKIKAMLKS